MIIKDFIVPFLVGVGLGTIIVLTYLGIAQNLESRSPRASSAVDSTGATNPVLEKINIARESVGKGPLVEDYKLSMSAEEKASDLAYQGYWSHSTPKGEKFSKLIFRYSPDAVSVGENLARCYDDPFNAWMNSPDHYSIIIGDWVYWGMGSATFGDCKIIVNHFSR